MRMAVRAEKSKMEKKKISFTKIHVKNRGKIVTQMVRNPEEQVFNPNHHVDGCHARPGSGNLPTLKAVAELVT